MHVFRAKALALLLLVGLTAASQTRERSTIPDQYKWNLADIYASDDAWRAAKEDFVAKMEKVGSYKGTIAESPARMLAAAEAITNLNKEYGRLFVYASLNSDTDTRNSTYQAMKQEMSQLGSTFAAATAWLQPEILKMDAAAVDKFLAAEPKLKPYRFFLQDLQRRKAHTLSEAEEKLIADASLMSPAGSDIYGIFVNSDFPFPTVTLADGTTRRLDASTFAVSRSLPNREDRKKVFEAFFGALGQYRNTLGSTMNANLQADMFTIRARKYPTTLDAALDTDDIPTSVYTSLVDGVNANLPTFHRYLELRKRMMGLDELHYYDLYAPLVSSVDLKYTAEEARKNIATALAPLGTDYTAVIDRAFRDRWIDLYPTPGKRSGAYSSGGAYDVHPYMLINYNGQYNDMSTVAHELGHTMQTYLSNKNQPYITAGYPIFVAEVASTFNESLLIDSMLKQITDPATRLALLGNYLEGFKGTVFRQTQFADFEKAIHDMAEKGEPITGDALDKLYLEMTRKYYGHDKGVCIVDDVVKHEWAYIPHFYRTYYVYQYATSFTASAALSEKVLNGQDKKGATAKYLAFLSAGGSKYPIDLLKDAGVDMTTSEPLDLTMKKMNRIMDEMEAALTKMGR
ncbi:MAG TPA: oligoendopeptidase F [Gemmatimonadaceae bacterium]|nr:MAG: oligoendopeptidase F [Acidobacteriota bacterium]HTD83781.1 oligoendopeptidase F [Gemmatimonadaceae bacterium]